MESSNASSEEIATFIRPLQGFLNLKNYTSARSILELLVEKYGAALSLSDWGVLTEGIVQVVHDALEAPKPLKRTMDLPSKLTSLAQLNLHRASEAQREPFLLLILEFWNRLGNECLMAAQKNGVHWLFLAACRSFARVMGFCTGPALQAVRKYVETSMDQLEMALLWYSCLPRVGVTLTQLRADLRTLSATETLDAVCAVFNTEPMIALGGVAAFFGPSQYALCKSLSDLLNPSLTELQSCLGTLAQKYAADSIKILALADRVSDIANHLMIFREFQDSVVQCYQILSKHTSEEKVLKLLAASWQTKLDLEVNPHINKPASFVSCWKRDKQFLSTLRQSCIALLPFNPDAPTTPTNASTTSSPATSVTVDVDGKELEFQARYSEGIIKLVQQMIGDILQSMGPSPCPFSVIATGSLSRNEMSFGSDLDLTILVRSREIPIAFFSRLIEQLELRLQWQNLALDELTVSYISKANEFGLNNVPALVCSLHAELAKGSTNVEPFALLWPTVVFSTPDGTKLCQECIEGTRAYFSSNLVCQQTGVNWLKSHMTNLKQYQRGSLLDSSQGSCNIKKELLQPLTVWILDFAVFNGIYSEFSALACLDALQKQGFLHPRFVAQIKQALIFLHSLRVQKQIQGSNSDELLPPFEEKDIASASSSPGTVPTFASSSSISPASPAPPPPPRAASASFSGRPSSASFSTSPAPPPPPRRSPSVSLSYSSPAPATVASLFSLTPLSVATEVKSVSSPYTSPYASPRASPHASPCSSPRGSVCNSPRGSPRSSPRSLSRLLEAIPLLKLTPEEWNMLQSIQRNLIKPILCATETLCSKLQTRLDRATSEGTRPPDIFASTFPSKFDPVMAHIAQLAHKIFQPLSESWDTGLEDTHDVSEPERRQIEADLAGLLSYLASNSARSVRDAKDIPSAIEAQRAVFLEIVPISQIRLLYCRFLKYHLQSTELPEGNIDLLMENLALCPTPSGARKVVIDAEDEWQRLLEKGLTCKSNSDASGLEAVLEWAYATEEQQNPPVRRVLRPYLQQMLLDERGRLKAEHQTASLKGGSILKLPAAELAQTETDATDQDVAFVIQVDHPDPCFQLSAQSLSSKITGYKSHATLAKLTVLKAGLPLDIVFPVLISRPFNAASIRGEGEIDHLPLDRRSFTLKLFETLVLRPEDESLANLVLEPISSLAQTTYRLHRVSHLNCFVRHAVIERREGPRKTEKLGCHSFVLCMSAMQEKLSAEAVAETLLLDPKQLLDSWLTDMDAHNSAYTSIEKSQSSVGKGPTFKWTSEPIFSSSEIRWLDKSRLTRHAHPLVSHAVAPNVVQSLFQRLVCLIQILKRHEAAKYTHLNLFEEMDPLLHHFYHSNCWASRAATSLQRWQSIPQGFNENKALYMGYAVPEPIQFINFVPETSSTLRDVNPRAAKGHLKQIYCFLSDAQLARGRLAKGLFRQNDQLLMDAAYEQMINSTDFQKLSRNDGWDNSEVVLEMFETIKFRALRLRHCELLTGSLLSVILQCSHSALTSLDISGCPNMGGKDINLTDMLSAIAGCRQLEVLDLSSLDSLTYLAVKSKKGKLKPLVFPRLQELKVSQCLKLTQIKIFAPCLSNVGARDCIALQSVEISSRIPLSVDLRGCHRLSESVLHDLFDPPFLKSAKLPPIYAETSFSSLPRAASSMRVDIRPEVHEGRSPTKCNQLLWVDFSGSKAFHAVNIFPEVSIRTLLFNNCPNLTSLTIQNDYLQALSLQDCHALLKLNLAAHNLHEIDLGGSYYAIFPGIISDVVQGCISLAKIRTRCKLSEIFKKREQDIDGLASLTTTHVAILTEPQDGVRQVCEEILQGTHDTVVALLVNIGSVLAVTSCFRLCTHSQASHTPSKLIASSTPSCCKARNVKNLVLKCPPGFDRVDQSGIIALSRMAQSVWLHSLHLEGMKLGDQGCMMVTEAFQSNSVCNLKKLYLVNTGIGDEGCVSVARLLQTCHLSELSLKDNRFGEKGARALATACQNTPQLRILDISENNLMTADGLYAIASAVEKHVDMKLRVGLSNSQLQKLAKNWSRKLKYKGILLRPKKDEPSKRDHDLDLDVRQCALCLALTEGKESCARCGHPLSFEGDVSLAIDGSLKKKDLEVTPKKLLPKTLFGDDGKNKSDSSPKKENIQTWTCSCGKINADENTVCECGKAIDSQTLWHRMRCLDNTALTPAQSFVDSISQFFKAHERT